MDALKCVLPFLEAE